MVWLEVLARGLVVQELGGTRKRRFLPAYKHVKAAVRFSTGFKLGVSALVKRFEHFANMRQSSWKRARDAKGQQKEDFRKWEVKVFNISNLEDFRKFLVLIQRVATDSAAFSAVCRPALPGPSLAAGSS